MPSTIWLPCKCLPSLCLHLLPCPLWLRSSALVKLHSLCSGRCVHFCKTRCTKYHEQFLYRGRVWVSVVPSLVNTHGDFVSCLISTCLLFHSVSAIRVSCGCPLSVALRSPFQFTSAQALPTRARHVHFTKENCFGMCCIQSVFICCHSFSLAKFLQKFQRKLGLAVFSVSDSGKCLSLFP